MREYPNTQQSKELDQFFDVSLDLLCIANAEGHFVRLNPIWETTLGFSKKELMVQQFLDFVHPDDLLGTREAISNLAAQEKIIQFENRYRCKDGACRWLGWCSQRRTAQGCRANTFQPQRRWAFAPRTGAARVFVERGHARVGYTHDTSAGRSRDR